MRELLIACVELNQKLACLSPRWTLVQRKAEGLLLYSAHGIDHSIIATTTNIAVVVNRSPLLGHDCMCKAFHFVAHPISTELFKLNSWAPSSGSAPSSICSSMKSRHQSL